MSFPEECKTAKLKLVQKGCWNWPKELLPNTSSPSFIIQYSSFKRLFMTKLKHFYMEMTSRFTNHSEFKPHYSQGLTHRTSLNNCRNGNNNALVFLDLQEVFDSLDHHILPEWMSSLDFQTDAIYWFKSCLSDQQFFVNIEHKCSEAGV